MNFLPINSVVAFINNDSYEIKSKKCNICLGSGYVLYKNDKASQTSCEKCRGYGYVSLNWNDVGYENMGKKSLGVIKGYQYNIEDNKIFYTIYPLKLNPIWKIFSDLSIYDIPNCDSSDFLVDGKDILESYPRYNYEDLIVIDEKMFQIFNNFEMGEIAYFADKNYDLRVDCDECGGDGKLESISGAKLRCTFCRGSGFNYVKSTKLYEVIISNKSIYVDFQECELRIRVQQNFNSLNGDRFSYDIVNSKSHGNISNFRDYQNNSILLTHYIDDALVFLGDISVE